MNLLPLRLHRATLAAACSACLTLAAPLSAADNTPGPIWLAIGSPAFLKELDGLAKHRADQGLTPVLSSRHPDEAIASCPTPPSFILLVGDEVWSEENAPVGLEHWQIRSKRAPFYRWKSTQAAEFPSDMAYGDLDHDGVPEVPVGRLPARTREEVSAAAAKILAWEKKPPAFADLRLPIWTGDPAYGPLFSRISASFLFMSLNLNAPKWLDFWVLNGDANHPLCGHPPDQPRLYNEQMGKGSIFTTMMGHGSTDEFWSLNSNGQSIGYRGDDARHLAGAIPTPPHIIFACSCGRYQSGRQRCLAESLLQASAGPVLSVAATIESHPLTNYYSSTALLRALDSGIKRFGPLWIAAQKDAMKRTEKEKEFLLAEIEGKLHGRMDPALLKRDQVLMYNILGDPATLMRTPRKLRVTVKKSDTAWEWTVEKPQGATDLRVEHRPPLSGTFTARTAELPAAEANALLDKTNRSLAFQPAETKSADAAWSGTALEKGTLRFLTTSSDGEICAGGVDLR